jgi:hypothetical protein
MENHLGKEFIYESRTPGMKNTQSQTWEIRELQVRKTARISNSKINSEHVL